MTLPLLLDTHICIWWLNNELPKAAETLLAEAFNTGRATLVSPITALEVATLVRKNRIRLALPPQRWFARLLAQPGVLLALMPPDLLIESQLLPGDVPRDPADRIIAATAREYGYRVMTRDHALLDYGKQGYLSVVAC